LHHIFFDNTASGRPRWLEQRQKATTPLRDTKVLQDTALHHDTTPNGKQHTLYKHNDKLLTLPNSTISGEKRSTWHQEHVTNQARHAMVRSRLKGKRPTYIPHESRESARRRQDPEEDQHIMQLSSAPKMSITPGNRSILYWNSGHEESTIPLDIFEV
jgi:hypothetical protein